MTNLERILKQRGIKQKVIAKKCGVSDAAVSFWLSQRSPVPCEARLIIASFLDIDPDMILNDVKEERQCA